MNNPPNVLFIMSDQHHADCMSITGRRQNVRTPNLDKLAGKGIRFGMAYSNNPVCSPSRICFHTGQYCHTHGMLGNINFEFNGEPLNDTISMRFRKHGYQTALIGKAHMVKKWDDAGYEYIRYCDLCDADRKDVLKHHYFKYLVDNGVADLYEDGVLPPEHPYTKKQYGVAKLPFEHTNEHWTGNEAIKFFNERNRNKPFFAHVSFERPHPNYLIAEKIKDMYNPEEIELPESIIDAFEHDFTSKPPEIRNHFRGLLKNKEELKKILAAYYTLINVIDAEIGRIIDCLKENGDFNNTIIVYTADHGDFAGDHGVYRKNIGTYESIHRIPFILKYPGCPAMVMKNTIIEAIDMYPTLCELCGIPAPAEVDGKSLLPVIAGTSPGKEAAISEWDSHCGYVTMVNSIRSKEYRLTYYGSDSIRGELYHTAKDFMEIRNLWNDPEYKDIKIDLLQKLLDRITGYRKRTTYQDDLAHLAKHANSPTRMIHQGFRKWSEVKSIHCENH